MIPINTSESNTPIGLVLPFSVPQDNTTEEFDRDLELLNLQFNFKLNCRYIEHKTYVTVVGYDYCKTADKLLPIVKCDNPNRGQWFAHPENLKPIPDGQLELVPIEDNTDPHEPFDPNELLEDDKNLAIYEYLKLHAGLLIDAVEIAIDLGLEITETKNRLNALKSNFIEHDEYKDLWYIPDKATRVHRSVGEGEPKDSFDIDPEFRGLIPPLTTDERQQLRQNQLPMVAAIR